MNEKKVISLLKNGKVGVLPTDTVYGLVGSALSEKAVERIYQLKKRDPKKPMIVLIGSREDLGRLGVKLRSKQTAAIKKYWPGPVSIIFPCPGENLSYFHRGSRTLAVRLPKPRWLRDLLAQTGPLSAPSANPEGEKPAETISQAKKYFGKQVDFYVDRGKLSGLPSTLIMFEGSKVIVRRQGVVKV